MTLLYMLIVSEYFYGLVLCRTFLYGDTGVCYVGILCQVYMGPRLFLQLWVFLGLCSGALLVGFKSGCWAFPSLTRKL